MKDLIKTFTVSEDVYEIIKANPIGLLEANKIGDKYRVRLQEIWRDVKGWKGYYQVSSFGRVKSLPRYFSYKWRNRTGVVILKHAYRKPTIKKQSLAGRHPTNIYYAVSLSSLKIGLKQAKVHQEVAKLFIPNPNKLPQVNHKKGALNNLYFNMEWVSARENCTHRFINKNTSSKYRGVTWNKKDNSWRAQIVVDGVKIMLGSFHTDEMANKVYRDALKKRGIINRYA